MFGWESLDPGIHVDATLHTPPLQTLLWTKYTPHSKGIPLKQFTARVPLQDTTEHPHRFNDHALTGQNSSIPPQHSAIKNTFLKQIKGTITVLHQFS